MFRSQLLGFAGAALLAPLAQAAPAPDDLSVCASVNQDDVVLLRSCLAVAHDRTRSDTDRAYAYVNAGLLRSAARDADTAIKYFGQAIAVNAKSDAAFAGRAIAEFAKDDNKAAITDARRAIELKPNNHPDAYVILGTLADRNGDHEAMIKYTSKAIALAPSYSPAYAARANGYAAEQRYDLALADLNKAVELEPDLATMLQPRFEMVYIERGDMSMEAKKYQAAIDDFSQALRLNPTNLRALNDRGDAYNVTGQFQKAIADLSQAIETDPSYAAAYGNRGVSYFQVGQDNLTLADLDKAIASGTASASFYFVRGRVHQHHFDRKPALAVARQH